MNILKNSVLALFCITSLSVSSLSVSTFFTSQVFAQTSVVVTVNGNPITSYDIQRRIAFLKLQQKQGNLAAQAKNELIDEALKNNEIKRRNIEVSKDEVESAFKNFALQNNMTVDQLNQMLAQTDVTVEHFKTYILGQMGWGRLVNARYQAEGGVLTEQETAHRILKNGGVKPSTNEYTLQRIIFVIPEHRRSAILEKRKKEANKFRANFHGCHNAQNQAKSILDVTIRHLGKFLEPQLPQNWEKAILATPAGKMTNFQETQYGIEALAICQIKRVSDDRVARLIFSIQDHQKKDIPQLLEALSEKYLKELRQTAHIQNS
ncbi:Peptidyl-prolyl cis-trans isomerase [Bartonella clarridgeiae 73]|uniref:Peptidyl-prolyl cis-trans isomerase n=1 Tax=Bartonella clarridgeiae (strain CCUG 45776 / CIP 104772 / 73) TaxID=696125 RepID=E6YHA0_BARC7|nr:peptidylprolyl isomerase [Bartonella clarridgeiae]WCR55182.1 MAG: Periplasmic chaperone and peptidyl-prolyl cis-trans isomerase of outer membrane proteins SurA [Bartonella clarridgeiae]CBI76238.1 Peptidyl-prolyl cis-trans isomerase [Bartonella clarridgeiae 73]